MFYSRKEIFIIKLKKLGEIIIKFVFACIFVFILLVLLSL